MNPGNPPARPPGATRPARPWRWPLLGAAALGLAALGGVAGYGAFMNLAARLMIRDQPLTMRLPPRSELVLRTGHEVDVLMKGTIRAQVPLVQTLDLPIDGVYDTQVDLDTRVPLETTIVYEGVIPVDSVADIEARAPVNFQNVKKYKNLHFKAKLPLKLRLPVRLVVPVRQVIPLRYRGPLRIAIRHVVRAPVGTTLDTALQVDQLFRVPVTTALPLRLELPQHPVKATITESDLSLDLRTLRLHRAD